MENNNKHSCVDNTYKESAAVVEMGVIGCVIMLVTHPLPCCSNVVLGCLSGLIPSQLALDQCHNYLERKKGGQSGEIQQQLLINQAQLQFAVNPFSIQPQDQEPQVSNAYLPPEIELRIMY